MKTSSHAAVPRGVFDFLHGILPFSELVSESLSTIVSGSLIEFFPKGMIVFKQGVTEVSHLHVVRTGGVRAYLSDADHLVTLKEYGGRGASFGAEFILKESLAEFNVEAVEDTFCLLIDKETFLKFHRENPRFADYYRESMTEDLIVAAYSEQRLEKIRARSEETFYLFSSRVIDMVKDPPEFVSPATPVKDVAAVMADRSLKCALVTDTSGAVIGTIENLDLRTKVVAKGLDYDTPADHVMNTKVCTLPALASSFEAVVSMMEHEVSQLVVLNKDEIVGVVDAADMMVHLGSSPLFLFREIGLQRNVEGLRDLAGKVPILVRSLVETGAKAGNIAQMISLFADNILKRTLDLIELDLGNPPMPYDWLGLASEGRREHTFRTDQSNGLLYADSKDPIQARRAEEYFRVFTAKAVETLTESGYPRCKNDFVAANTRWCKPWDTWREYFDDWIMTPIPPDIYLSQAFFDFRSVAGCGLLADSLRDHVKRMVRKYPLFLKFFARYFLLNEPPLSFYEGVIVEKDGSQIELLDLKTRGVTPFVDFARILALIHGVNETNTLSRLDLLRDQDLIPDDLYRDVCGAFDYDVHLLLVHQLRFVEEGNRPQNFVTPAELSDLERKTLQFSFSVIEKMMDFIKRELNVTSKTVPPVVAKSRRTVLSNA